MIDGLRLGVGLLTVLPVGQARADRALARSAMLAAPLVGAALGALAWLIGALLLAAGAEALVAAVASVAVLAASTRGLHLDGLADLADGLGSGRPAAGALEVMRRSDIGPFGVVTLLLVVLAQVAALEHAWTAGVAGPALAVSAAAGRLALVWACRRGVPAARPEGLGALVAGTIPTSAAAATTGVVIAAAAAWGVLTGDGIAYAAAVVAGVAAGVLLLRRAVRRLGGITGDVLGAVVEAGTTAALLVLVLVAA